MNNNNFISKTLKTFLTSLFVSVFIFGSLYFFLSDNTTSENTSKDSKVAGTSNEKSKKLVVNEEPTSQRNVENFVAKQTETERQVLGATTDSLIAQNIPGATDYTSPFQTDLTATTPATTPTAAITGTLPANLANNTVYASGVPQTGNESLYVILGLFSAIAGFLIVNGKSFAMKSFEQA